MQRGSLLGPTVYGHRTVLTSAAYHGQFDNIRLCDIVQESEEFSAQNILHTRQVSGKVWANSKKKKTELDNSDLKFYLKLGEYSDQI